MQPQGDSVLHSFSLLINTATGPAPCIEGQFGSFPLDYKNYNNKETNRMHLLAPLGLGSIFLNLHVLQEVKAAVLLHECGRSPVSDGRSPPSVISSFQISKQFENVSPRCTGSPL